MKEMVFMSIRLLIVEDHDFTRQGLIYGLKKDNNITIIGEARNGQQAIDLTLRHSPDIVLMDLEMPVINGIQATREIKQFNNKIKVLVFTSYTDKNKVLASFNSGADAYCIKNIKIPELIKVIELVVKGTVWIDPKIASYVLEILQTKTIADEIENDYIDSQKVNYNLTIREKEILNLVAQGLTNKEISEKLVISIYTVKHHVSKIIKKLAVDDRTQAAVIALKDDFKT